LWEGIGYIMKKLLLLIGILVLILGCSSEPEIVYRDVEVVVTATPLPEATPTPLPTLTPVPTATSIPPTPTPKSVSDYFKEGMECAVKKDYSCAEAMYITVKFSNSKINFYNINVELGDLYYEQGDYSRALAEYNIALNSTPLDPTVTKRDFISRGEIYILLAMYTEAIADFTQSINMDPAYVYAYASRGKAHYKNNNWQLAINDYNIAINLQPEGFWNRYAIRAYCHMELNNHQLAIADLTKVIDNADYGGTGGLSDGALADRYNSRGSAYFDLNRYIDALNDYSSASILDPTNNLYRGNIKAAASYLN